MTYEVKQDKGYSIVLLNGDVDLSCSPDARKVILECLEASHNTLVDLSAVDYIDSSGVASLVEGLRLARTRGLEFSLAAVSASAVSSALPIVTSMSRYE